MKWCQEDTMKLKQFRISLESMVKCRKSPVCTCTVPSHSIDMFYRWQCINHDLYFYQHHSYHLYQSISYPYMSLTRGQDIEHVVGQPSVRECTRLAPAALFYAYLGLVEETKRSVLQVKWGLWLPCHDLPEVMFVCVFLFWLNVVSAEPQKSKTQKSEWLKVKPGASAQMWYIPVFGKPKKASF